MAGGSRLPPPQIQISPNLSPKSSQTLAHPHTLVQPVPRPKPAKITGKPPGISPKGGSGPVGHPSHAGPLRVPFRPTTLASRAITFKGFLTTLTLPREEVATVRGPINRAQPPFHHFSLTGFFVFISNFFSLFRVRPGLGTFGSAHSHLDLPLRSLTSPTSHRVVPEASVPTSFFPSCRGCFPLGLLTRSLQPSLATSSAASPTLFLS
ncbi:hypothetical protein CRG98_018334 [Punica granatum]|uniref:Uncharacterized protein n=1 Tax=Punica granatum TaxID=22663 RepID=A0A2I0JZJ2_PUNGR|nr:hypothetical protein CRG98_018334 [Punica granatum]